MDKQSNTRRAAHERAQRYHTVLNTNCCYAKKSVLLLRLWVSATTCWEAAREPGEGRALKPADSSVRTRIAPWMLVVRKMSSNADNIRAGVPNQRWSQVSDKLKQRLELSMHVCHKLNRFISVVALVDYTYFTL